MSRIKLEERVLSALQTHLMDEELCATFCEAYTTHMNTLRSQQNAALEGYKSEYAKIERQMDKLVDSIVDGIPPHQVKDRMVKLDQRRMELEHLLATTEEAPVLLHPNMAKRYHEEVQNLITALQNDDFRSEAAQILRTLIDKIVLTPVPGEQRLSVDIQGDLAGILAIASASKRHDIKQISEVAGLESKTAPELGSQTGAQKGGLIDHLPDGPAIEYPKQGTMVAGGRSALDLPRSDVQQDTMVAGARFELTTFRL